jgi:uncharacterized protein YacL
MLSQRITDSEVAMKTSLMFKIGITGMVASILVPVIALVMSLMGNDSLSHWISGNFNENIAMVLMIVLIFMIIYPVVKKSRQKFYEDMRRNDKP